MWGIVPAAGAGTRIQPLAFSKELLPVGSRLEDGVERPRAVSEYLVERMVRGGATRICFVVSPGKSDILAYYGAGVCTAHVCYTVQPRPAGLCDAIFRALPMIAPEDEVLVGLPDTVWFPADGFRHLPGGTLAFLLFPVTHPEYFDAVVTDGDGRVREIQVKSPTPSTRWVWGAFKLTGTILRDLHALWRERDERDEYLGTLVNEWLARGGSALGARAGEAYVDVGTLHGYREAIRVLGRRAAAARDGLGDPAFVISRPGAGPRPAA
jgi:glucose-1-phosphate thymidylyltransferase